LIPPVIELADSLKATVVPSKNEKKMSGKWIFSKVKISLVKKRK